MHSYRVQHHRRVSNTGCQKLASQARLRRLRFFSLPVSGSFGAGDVASFWIAGSGGARGLVPSSSHPAAVVGFGSDAKASRAAPTLVPLRRMEVTRNAAYSTTSQYNQPVQYARAKTPPPTRSPSIRLVCALRDFPFIRTVSAPPTSRVGCLVWRPQLRWSSQRGRGYKTLYPSTAAGGEAIDVSHVGALVKELAPRRRRQRARAAARATPPHTDPWLNIQAASA